MYVRFLRAWCDCSWFQASTITRGRVPRRNETFGCEIQNLTECIKAEQTADAKGTARPKWWLPISWLYHISLCFQPNKWPNCVATVPVVWTQIPIVCHIRYPDTSDKRNYWSCQSGVFACNLLQIVRAEYEELDAAITLFFCGVGGRIHLK